MGRTHCGLAHGPVPGPADGGCRTARRTAVPARRVPGRLPEEAGLDSVIRRQTRPRDRHGDPGRRVRGHQGVQAALDGAPDDAGHVQGPGVPKCDDVDLDVPRALAVRPGHAHSGRCPAGA
ncbi:hypothetical protein ACRJ4W_39005 [Streptomyces sp. GLT-R25]